LEARLPKGKERGRARKNKIWNRQKKRRATRQGEGGGSREGNLKTKKTPQLKEGFLKRGKGGEANIGKIKKTTSCGGVY